MPDSPQRSNRDGLEKKKHKPKPPQGSQLQFKDPEPWPDTVSGWELATEISDSLRRYLVLPDGAFTAVMLWVLHTYAVKASDVFPILALISPEMQCGKTTTLNLLRYLVRRPLMASHTTTAPLFRAIQMCHPTLLIDEADSFVGTSEELRGILNSGHLRTGAVIRTVGEDFEPRAFSTFGPKAIAAIKRLPKTLLDRSIVVELRRRSPTEHVERLRLDRCEEFEQLTCKAMRWARDNEMELRALDPDVPRELNDRAADNWRPLLAIADLLGGQWPGLARQAALQLCGASTGKDSSAVQLLSEIRQMFKVRGVGLRLSSAQVAHWLARQEDSPWAEYRNGRPITAAQVARLLRPFSIEPRAMRIEGKILRGYDREQFEDAFSRYLPADAQQPQQVAPDAPKAEPSHRNGSNAVSSRVPALEVRLEPRVAVVASLEPVALGTPQCPCGGRVLKWPWGYVCSGCHTLLTPLNGAANP